VRHVFRSLHSRFSTPRASERRPRKHTHTLNGTTECRCFTYPNCLVIVRLVITTMVPAFYTRSVALYYGVVLKETKQLFKIPSTEPVHFTNRITNVIVFGCNYIVTRPRRRNDNPYIIFDVYFVRYCLDQLRSRFNVNKRRSLVGRYNLIFLSVP